MANGKMSSIHKSIDIFRQDFNDHIREDAVAFTTINGKLDNISDSLKDIRGRGRISSNHKWVIVAVLLTAAISFTTNLVLKFI